MLENSNIDYSETFPKSVRMSPNTKIFYGWWVVVGLAVGILTLGYGLIGGSGPLIWGKIYDVTGSYNLASLFSAICLFLVIICVWEAKPVNNPPNELNACCGN